MNKGGYEDKLLSMDAVGLEIFELILMGEDVQ